MSIKKQWLYVLVLIAITSVIVSTLVLSLLINKNFIEYKENNYKSHLEQIIKYTKNALLEGNYTKQQLTVQLEAHLSDPITRIKLYDEDGKLLVEVANEDINMRHGMMRNRMFNGMMGSQKEEVDHGQITDDQGNLIGQLNITRYSSIANSFETRQFKYTLIINGLISIGLVLILAIFTGQIMSKKMSKDLIGTALFAQNIDLGSQAVKNKPSKISEIRVIQQSLETLQAKLKLKQKSRKKLIDQLVHETRTPLTILKTHIEGFEDGIIEMSPDEIKVCENQIENLASIIENMSSMIDAQNEIDMIKEASFEVYQLLKQIINGLSAQFQKKNIKLTLLSTQKLTIKSDKYILSQAIYNILTNAYKFTNAKGKVEVSYTVNHNELIITIEDNGIGIHHDDIHRIFDAYYRSNDAYHIDGEGLGLYIVKENMNKICGEVYVESEEGKGSRFVLKLPYNK